MIKAYDRLYVPRLGWTTGDLDIHDIGMDPERRPIFVNTLFGCLATVSERHSFSHSGSRLSFRSSPPRIAAI